MSSSGICTAAASHLELRDGVAVAQETCLQLRMWSKLQRGHASMHSCARRRNLSVSKALAQNLLSTFYCIVPGAAYRAATYVLRTFPKSIYLAKSAHKYFNSIWTFSRTDSNKLANWHSLTCMHVLIAGLLLARRQHCIGL